MNNIKQLGLSFIAIFTIAFSGCGSDSEDGESGTTISSDLTSTTDEYIPINTTSAYDCESTITQGGLNLTIKLSATGKFTCSEYYGAPQLDFAEGVNEIAISQLTSDQYYKGNEGEATITINLEAGTEHIVGTSVVYGDFDCITTYDIGDLPLYIYNADELENFDLADYQELSTTCPAWVNEETDSPTISGIFTTDTTITDTTGTISTVLSYTSF